MLNDDDELVLESLLLRYLDGRCTAAERAAIERNPAWRQRAAALAREEARVQQRFQSRAPGAAPPPDEVVAFIAGTLADPRQAQLAQWATTDPQVAAEIALLRALGPNPLLPPDTVPPLADAHPDAARLGGPTPHPARALPTRHPHRWHWPRRGRLAVAAVVAACSLLVLIGLGVSGGLDWARDYLMPDSDPRIVVEAPPRPAATVTREAPGSSAEAPSPPPEVAEASAAGVALSEEETAESGLAMGEEAPLAWELGSAESAEAGVPGSPGAEEAIPSPSGDLLASGHLPPSGHLRLARSTGTITLTITHFPALSPGQVYQLWFLYGNPPLRIESIATFTVDPQGAAERQIKLPQPVAPPDVIIVTREASEGSAQPTGPAIVIGVS